MPSDDSDNSTAPADLLADMRAFQQGDEDRFERLYEAMWGPICRRAAKMGIRGADRCEDIAQKVLVRVYLHARKARFDSPPRMWAWVYTIATREVYKEWRRRRELLAADVSEDWPLEPADPAQGPAAASVEAEIIEAVGECIDRLDEQDRLAALLVLVQEATFRASAKMLGLTLGQFKHRYATALEQVRRCLKAKGHETD